MFCLGCGSEITLRTVVCPVCGLRVGEATRPTSSPASVSSSRNALGSRLPAPDPHAPPGRAHGGPPVGAYADMASQEDPRRPSVLVSGGIQPGEAPSALATGDATDTAPRISAMRPPAPTGSVVEIGAIRWGDLDGVTFPRDASGRVVLAASALVVLSLFLPWVSFASVSITPNHLGRVTLATIALAIAAAAPTLWGSQRRRRLAAVAPFGIGALLLGAGLLYADQYLSISAQEGVTLGIGLYLYLASAATLVIAGYRLLMEALLAQPAAGVGAHSAPSVAASRPAYPSAPADAGAAQSVYGPGAREAVREPYPSTPATPATPAGPTTSGPLRPGDPRWDEAPTPPPVVRRPAYGGGWGRGGVSRR